MRRGCLCDFYVGAYFERKKEDWNGLLDTRLLAPKERWAGSLETTIIDADIIERLLDADETVEAGGGDGVEELEVKGGEEEGGDEDELEMGVGLAGASVEAAAEADVGVA